MIIHKCISQHIFKPTLHFLRPPLFSTAEGFKQKKYSLVDDYEITGFIGKGSTSRVYQGYNIINRNQVIIKLFKDTIAEQKILKEIYVNQIISGCEHVVPLVDVIRDEGCGSYGLIFKNLHGVPLTEVIKFTDFKKGLGYVKGILQAIQFCHMNGIVHRDLKKSNILITGCGAKLFDFGLSKIEKFDQFVTKRFGTKCYYTPQMIFKLPQFTRKVDIWVCGLIMAQVLSQTKSLMPYSSDEATQRQIVQLSGYSHEIVGNTSLKYLQRINFKKLLAGKHCDPNIVDNAASVIQKMMRIEPTQRPEASQILAFDLFKNVDLI